MIIKKWNGSSFDELYPKTKASEIFAADGITGVFDANLKIKVEHLPDLAFGGLKFVDTLVAADVDTDGEIAVLLDDIHQSVGIGNLGAMKGHYFVIGESLTFNATPNSQQAGTTGRYYSWEQQNPNEEGGTTTPLTFEAGDWLVITDVFGLGDSQIPYVVNLSIVNNTYQSATSSSLGVVKLFSDTAQTTAANTVTTTANRTYGVQNNGSGQLVVNVPWVDTNTTYSAATSSVAGLIELFSDTVQSVAANAVSATASRTYGIQVNGDGQAVVNIPWTDTNTTYAAGEGLTLTGTTFRETFPVYVQTDAPTTTITNALWFDI